MFHMAHTNKWQLNKMWAIKKSQPKVIKTVSYLKFYLCYVYKLFRSVVRHVRQATFTGALKETWRELKERQKEWDRESIGDEKSGWYMKPNRQTFLIKSNVYLAKYQIIPADCFHIFFHVLANVMHFIIAFI